MNRGWVAALLLPLTLTACTTEEAGNAAPRPSTASSRPPAKPKTSATRATVSSAKPPVQITVANPKTVGKHFDCANDMPLDLVSTATGMEAGERDILPDCGARVRKNGRHVGTVSMQVSFTDWDEPGAKRSDYRGNTAFKVSGTLNTCVHAIAVIDDPARYDFERFFEVRVVAQDGGACEIARKIAEAVFDKLPDA
ncbi:MAG TPA: hypothetical protein VM677_07365 [Actinokineospora sp.]|jgi:hypothetical protein|nr:hypothetical protein [Actinokineospora sp.]